MESGPLPKRDEYTARVRQLCKSSGTEGAGRTRSRSYTPTKPVAMSGVDADFGCRNPPDVVSRALMQLAFVAESIGGCMPSSVARWDPLLGLPFAAGR